MYRRIELMPERLKNQEELQKYLQEEFQFEGTDSLSEVKDDVDFFLTPKAVTKLCEDSNAYAALLAIGSACENNKHLHLRIRGE